MDSFWKKILIPTNTVLANKDTKINEIRLPLLKNSQTKEDTQVSKNDLYTV